jgi:Domain of unknown function (DUF4375)
MEPSSLTEAQRQLVALGWLRAEVNNGGFHQYFSNSAGNETHVAIRAAHDAALHDLAELIQSAAAVLGDIDLGDRDAREGALDERGDAATEYLDVLDQEYYRIEATMDLDRALDDLVWAHRADFFD